MLVVPATIGDCDWLEPGKCMVRQPFVRALKHPLQFVPMVIYKRRWSMRQLVKVPVLDAPAANTTSSRTPRAAVMLMWAGGRYRVQCTPLRTAISLETPSLPLPQLAWAHAHETLLWASKGKGARHTFNYHPVNGRDPSSQLSSVWSIPAVPGREKLHGYHPTQKPLRLLRRAVLACTLEGDLVFDPFCWSGTTGVAAKELGRFFVGAESERSFAELAGRRIKAAVRREVLRGLVGAGDC